MQTISLTYIGKRLSLLTSWRHIDDITSVSEYNARHQGAIQNHNQTVGMPPEIIGQISTDLDLACCNGR